MFDQPRLTDSLFPLGPMLRFAEKMEIPWVQHLTAIRKIEREKKCMKSLDLSTLTEEQFVRDVKHMVTIN